MFICADCLRRCVLACAQADVALYAFLKKPARPPRPTLKRMSAATGTVYGLKPRTC